MREITLCRWFPLAFGAVLLLVAAGCGSGRSTVKGKVTYKGAPVDGASITFVPESGKGPGASGAIADGAYTIEKVPVGKMKITIVALQPLQVGPKFGKDAGRIKLGPPKDVQLPPGVEMKPPDTKPGTPVPFKYNAPETTPLVFEVKKGQQEHDITLED
jgi:hypothetical protein